MSATQFSIGAELMMTTYIILLRAVMPSGKNKVPMAQLREVLVEAGFKNVRTYIQSGNAIVDTELPAMEVEKQVHELIKKYIGPDLVVVVRTSIALQKILANNPFQEGYDISRVFFVLFAQIPATEKVKELLTQNFGDEKLAIAGDAAYLYIPSTYGRGKLSNNFLEKELSVSATMRNYNTLSKLVGMTKG
jgi:uncharacterized protein (DUF1697 family)